MNMLKIMIIVAGLFWGLIGLWWSIKIIDIVRLSIQLGNLRKEIKHLILAPAFIIIVETFLVVIYIYFGD